MIDPDLKIELDKINQNLVAIQKNKGRGLWFSFFHGMFGALGYIVGLAIVVVILGWFLQKNGLLEAFVNQVKSFTDLVDSAKNLIPSNKTTTTTTTTQTNQQSGGDPTTVTLPNGQQIKINLPAGY
jgi:hypothetical protein